MDLPRDLCLALLDRAHRACLHRLRGTVQVLGGWATLGLPAHAPDETLRERMTEVQEVTDWLEKLWVKVQSSPTDLLHDEALPWLLAASLRAGTPSEAKQPLPNILVGEAGLALAAWAEAIAGDSSSPKFVLRTIDDDHVLCRVQGPDLRIPADEVMTAIAPWLTPEPLGTDHLGIGASVVCSGLRMQEEPDQAEAVQTRA